MNYHFMNKVTSYFIPLTITIEPIGTLCISYGVKFKSSFIYGVKTF